MHPDELTLKSGELAERLRFAHTDDGWTDNGGVVLSRQAAVRLTSVHLQTFECVATQLEEFSAELPKVDSDKVTHLDDEGVARVGSTVRSGDLLVGKRTPLPPSTSDSSVEQELDALFGASLEDTWRDTSLRVLPWMAGEVMEVRHDAPAKKRDPVTVQVDIGWSRVAAVGDELQAPDGRRLVVTSVREALPGGVDALWAAPPGEVAVTKVGCAAETFHARSIGPYSLVTQQPLATRNSFGGQRLRRVDLTVALAAGATALCAEWLTAKSDGVRSRSDLYESIVRGRPRITYELPAGVEVLVGELRALALGVDLDGAPRLSVLDSQAVRALAPHAINKPETINYRTFVPETGGLFCKEAFGPLHSTERRTQLAHIELANPVVHPLFKKTVACLLGIEPGELEQVLRYELALVDGALDDDDASMTGAVSVREGLERVALSTVASSAPDRQLRDLAAALSKAGIHPAQFVLDAWPVLPPDLRPLVPLSGGRFATSDLNDLYRRVINRNNRLRRLRALNAPAALLRAEAATLQNAIDHLVDNTGSRRLTGPDRRPLVALTSLVQNRFSVTLLRKRVDYSAEAVLVADPSLPDDQCRVPRTILLELLKPFLYEALDGAGHVRTIKQARKLVEDEAPEALAALSAVLPDRPMVLAPFGEDLEPEGALVGCEVSLAPGLAVHASPPIAALLGSRVSLHVPITAAAVNEARTVLRSGGEPVAQGLAGWLGRALDSEDPMSVITGAALTAEEDPMADPWSRLALGVPV